MFLVILIFISFVLIMYSSFVDYFVLSAFTNQKSKK